MSASARFAIENSPIGELHGESIRYEEDGPRQWVAFEVVKGSIKASPQEMGARYALVRLPGRKEL